ncbi:hypothetical protein L543_2719 [Bordetella hinzii L60]|nr:hypothetical protein L543_2719 [Bordetella hinzii L60]
MLLQVALAQTDGLGRDLDQFIVVDEFHRVLQRQLNGRHQAHGLVRARSAHVGQLLTLDRIDDQVVVAAVDADDHAFVQRFAGADEHAAAVLQLPEGIGHGIAVVLADQHAIAALADRAFAHRRVLMEGVAHQARAARERQELVLEADQATRRDDVFQAGAAAAIGLHVLQVAAAAAQLFHYPALVRIFDIHRQGFERLALHAVDFLEHHARARDGQLIAFAAHGFKQDGQVQFAAARDFEHRVVAGVAHAQRHVGLELSLQAVAQLAAGHELAFAAGQRRSVDHEVHGQGGLVDAQHGQRLGRGRIGHRRADVQVLDAVDQDDVAGFGFFHDLALQATELQHLVDAAALDLALGAKAEGDVHAGTHAAAVDAAHADLADVAVVVQRDDLHLQRAVGIVVALRHVLQDGFEQRTHVAAAHVLGQAGVARQARGVDHRKVELLFGGAQLVEQFERGVDDKVRARAGTVDLVDHDNGLEAQGQRLAGHEDGLRHRAFHRVDQQQHAIDHGQHALDLAAEVGVSRGVDDVDVGALVLDGAILGQNRDAAFFFQVVRVHDPFSDRLVLAEGAGLAQQLVDQGRLAVVHVGDDGDVAQCAGHSRSFKFRWRAANPPAIH